MERLEQPALSLPLLRAAPESVEQPEQLTEQVLQVLPLRSEHSDEVPPSVLQSALRQIEPQLDLPPLLREPRTLELQVQRLAQESWVLQPVPVHHPEWQEQPERVVRVTLRTLAPRVALRS